MWRQRPTLYAFVCVIWALRAVDVLLGAYVPWLLLARKLAALHDWIELAGLTGLTEAGNYCMERAKHEY